MRSILTIFWIVIIAGSIFIVMHLLNPESNKYEPIIEPEQIPDTIEDVDTIDTEPIKRPEIKIENIEEEILSIIDSPKTYTEHLAVGDTYMQNNYIEAAIKEYLTAKNLNQNSTDPLIRLGEAYLKNNEPAAAKGAFMAAEKLDPDSMTIKIGIARALLNERKIEEAKDYVWTLDNSDYQVKYYTGIILILYKDFEGAKNSFKAIISADPPAPSNLVEKSRKFTTNFQWFEYFTEESPLYLQLLLAKSMVDVGEYEASIPLTFDVINEKSNYRDAWIILGYAYLQTGKIDDAIDALIKAKDLAPEKPETLFYLGLSYAANNDIDKAIFYLEKAEDEGYKPQDQLNLKLGDLYLQKEEMARAAKKYEETIALNPSNMAVFVKAVWLNIDELDNPKKALKLAEEAMDNFPDNAMSYNLVAWAKIELDDDDEAKELLLQAIEMDPELDAAYLNLGQIYEKEKSYSVAKEYYKKAYDLGDGNAIATLAVDKYNNLKADISSPSSP